MKQLFLKYKQFILYAIVGSINTLVDYGVYSLVFFFTNMAMLSQGAGYCIGTLCSFVLNRGITFRDENGGSPLFQFLRFVLVNCVSLAVSILGIQLLTQQFGLNGYLAKLPIVVLTFCINYVGYKLLVFRKKAEDKAEKE